MVAAGPDSVSASTVPSGPSIVPACRSGAPHPTASPPRPSTPTRSAARRYHLVMRTRPSTSAHTDGPGCRLVVLLLIASQGGLGAPLEFVDLLTETGQRLHSRSGVVHAVSRHELTDLLGVTVTERHRSAQHFRLADHPPHRILYLAQFREGIGGEFRGDGEAVRRQGDRKSGG